MSKSILQDEKECWACKTTLNLHSHHCIYGIANRRNSEKYGLKVYLCVNHHVGQEGVHNGNKQLDLELKQLAQREFEKRYGHEKYMEVFHISFI